MAIHCPYCQYVMKLRDARPGRYRPACRKCNRQFLLTIPTDADSEPHVQPLPASAKSSAKSAASGSDETTPATAKPATVKPSTAKPSPLPHSPAPEAAPGDTLPATSVPATSPPADPDTAGWEATMPAEVAGATVGTGQARTAPGGPQEVDRQSAVGGGLEATAVSRHAPTHPQTEAATAAELPDGVSGSSAGVPVGRTLGGYRLLRELGRGAMGAVYLARQLSLDRDVALKTIQASLANDPQFIARFTREAYAAAQLTHHNVVQIYDLGAEDHTHFFSMELVDGDSLADVLRREGKLEPKLAVSYTLQAARGLHYAHQLGMVHRDVKPGNLLLNRLGVVKVADLGLVKTRAIDERAESRSDSPDLHRVLDSHTTLRNSVMGTPAFMAPEQASSAADVDQRADIYSLGCTLYTFLTGRPPFDGQTAAELITKHRTAAVVRPDAVVKDVPAALAEIVLKMVAKEPDQRYADLGEVIRDLEAFLGIGPSFTATEREEVAARLERWASQFAQAPAAKMRTRVLWGCSGTFLAVGLISLLFGAWSVAFAAVGAAILTPVFATLFAEWRRRGYLIGKLRELLFASTWSDYLTWGAAAILLLLGVVVLQLVGAALAAVLISLLVAGGLAFTLERRLDAERREPLDQINDLLKRLRVRGEEEANLRELVARFSGEPWEEWFEALFGYEAKLEARQAWGKSADGKPRARHAVWRDALIRSIDARVAARRKLHQRRHLQAVEQAELQASGLSPDEARRQATAHADALVAQAAQLHATLAAAALEQNPQVAAARKRERIKAMLAEARGGADRPEPPAATPGRIASLLLLPFSGKVRFLIGALLLAACFLWLRQNGIAAGRIGEIVRILTSGSAELEPLKLPLLPATWNAVLSGLNVGAAGLMLILSAILFRSYRICLFVIPAAFIMLLGPRIGIPTLFGLSTELVSLTIGGGICLLGVVFGRSPD